MGGSFSDIQTPRDIVPHYKCGPVSRKGGAVASPSDSDDNIRKHPTEFRFSVGDRALLNLDLAFLPKRALNHSINDAGTYCEGTLTQVDITGKFNGYFVYECECSFDTQEQFKCYILRDDDQHIARIDADPREQLFKAISQDCHPDHLTYLESTYSIDISMFLDLVVDKAFEHGSYYIPDLLLEAFLWLQENHKYDIHAVMDSSGNNFLHRIAKSANAVRFIEKLVSHIDDDPKLDMINLKHFARRRKVVITNAVNSDGQTWLEILVKKEDVRAFDLALSPLRRFSWRICIYRCGKVDSLMQCVQHGGNKTMKLILESFELRQKMKILYDSLYNCFDETEDEWFKRDGTRNTLCGPDATLNAEHFIRFIRDWRDHAELDYSVFSTVVKKGFSKTFELLYSVSDALFWNQKDSIPLNEDYGQYIQPEISSYAKSKTIFADLLTICILGEYESWSEHESFEKQRYFRDVQTYFQSPEASGFMPFVSYLKAELARCNSKNYDKYKYLIKHKLSIYEDSQSLTGRLKILSRIQRDRPSVKLDVLLVIRNRQCGVLRWMVEQNLIDLYSDINRAELALDDFCFIKGFTSVTLGVFLCFAAVEYDDLFSLQWLCQRIGCPEIRCDGMNILHLAALFGRLEIVGWLHSCQLWDNVVNESCTYDELNGLYAAHIAAGQGHVQIAEMLLKFGCKEHDKHKKPPEYYAERSPIVASISLVSDYKFVHEWASQRAGKICFDQEHEHSIKKLLGLLEEKPPIDLLKSHIAGTKPLEVQRWIYSGCDSFDQPGPDSLSYGDILEKCLTLGDALFAEWLIIFLKFEDGAYASFWKEKNRKRLIRRDDLLLAARERGQRAIADILSHDLVGDIDVHDPKEDSIFSLPSLQSCSYLSDRLQSKLIEIRTLTAIVHSVELYGLTSAINASNTTELTELMRIYKYIREVLRCTGVLDEHLTKCYSCIRSIAENESLLEMNTMMAGCWDYEDHPLLEHVLKFRSRSPFELFRLHYYIVIEAQAKIVDFCLDNIVGWTADIEKDMILSASFLGHTDIVNLLLHHDGHRFLSDFNSRHRRAIFGACIAGRYCDLLLLAAECDYSVEDPIKNLLGSDSAEKMEYESAISTIADSLLASTIRSFITEAHSDLRMISFLVQKWKYSNHDVMHSLDLALFSVIYNGNECQYILRLLDIYNFVYHKCALGPVHHKIQLQELAGIVLDIVERNYENDKPKLPTDFLQRVLDWLDSLIIFVDLQDLSYTRIYGSFYGCRDDMIQFVDNLSQLKEKQRKYWAQFDVVKKGQSLADVQQSVLGGHLSTNGYDRGGLQLIHLAASYERLDILKWLIKEKNFDLKSLDGDGRTPQQVAKAAKAATVSKWIETCEAGTTISNFISRNLQRIQSIQKHRRMVRRVIRIQKVTRGYFIRKFYRGSLLHRLEEAQQFQIKWAHSIGRSENLASGPHSWEAVRSSARDISHADVVDSFTADRLDEALSKVFLGDNEKDILAEQSELIDVNETETCSINHQFDALNEVKWPDTFQVTSHVVKFLKSGDPLYRSFFVRRLQQLASGDRSRILQKRLKGSKSTIYETYLEQKSGFRILWTEEGETIVVWFVAKHKSVSRLMQLIDDAKSRSARQQIPDHLIDQSDQTRESDKILLDVGNAPLKVYDISFHELDDITKASWTPHLHLTDEEKNVVEANGTVLLLGRSGTGKTLCICNRMELDRQQFDCDLSFTQLFVSRSSRLCKYVNEVVGAGSEGCCRSFTTFKELTHQIESLLGVEKNKSFIKSHHVDFYRFEREFYNVTRRPNEGLSALLVWKTIQTFLKGSIEAFQTPDHVLPKDYFVSGSLGKNRCRLSPDHREQVYSIFLDYQKYLKLESLWDDCDRMVALLTRIEQSKSTDSLFYDNIRKSKVYVDEIQDFTQIECLLFFLIDGPGGLFLAGDPAQSVVEGTDFRFEEIRSVGHFVADQDRRDLIPQKPKTVNVNFRSHSGILNTAAAVLDHLFAHFPSSAKQLKRDYGLFQGPRPGVCYNIGYKKFSALFKGKLKGVVVLTHDDSTARWKRALDYPLVYGIRESKGLEFKSVFILDFFCELPSALQKPWRDMVLKRTETDFSTRHPLVENSLKLLYTAITRSIEQLHFVETSQSIAGDAIVRWLTTTTVQRHNGEHVQGVLATKRDITNLESITMTSDEWVASAIDNAEMAQTDEIELLHALSLLDRSVYCFEQAQAVDLATKARAHRQSAQFRLELTTKPTSNDNALLESKAAQLFDILLAEDLLEEAVRLIKTILPHVSPYSREQLDKQVQVLPKIHLHL